MVGTELVLLPPLLTMVLAGEGPVKTEPETAEMGASGVPVGDMATNGILKRRKWRLDAVQRTKEAAETRERV